MKIRGDIRKSKKITTDIHLNWNHVFLIFQSQQRFDSLGAKKPPAPRRSAPSGRGKATSASTICALRARRSHQCLDDLRPTGAEKPPMHRRSAPSGRGEAINAWTICALWARKSHQYLDDLRPLGAEKPPMPRRSAPSGRGKPTSA